MTEPAGRSPSDLALEVVADLVVAEPSSRDEPECGSPTGPTLRASATVAQRLAAPAMNELGVASLCKAAVRVVARGDGNPFADFLEADERVIELYQWYRAQRGPDAARLLAARCIDDLIPDLQADGRSNADEDSSDPDGRRIQ